MTGIFIVAQDSRAKGARHVQRPVVPTVLVLFAVLLTVELGNLFIKKKEIAFAFISY